MVRKTLFLTAVVLSLGAMAPASTDSVIDLCGVWEILPDVNNTGLENQWFKPGYQGDWRPIVVPSSWETVLGTEFDGIAWYRRQFRVPADKTGHRVLLRFHGAATEARIWVNGREVGGHIGPWTPFTFDVTRYVGLGEPAWVVVRLDEKVGHSTQGFLPIIAPHFGGLWQKVEVILKKAAWFDDTRVTVDSTEIRLGDSSATLRASVPVEGQVPDGTTVQFALVRNRRVIHRGTAIPVLGGTADWKWQGRADFWDIGKPNLYQIQMKLLAPDGEILDRISKPVGFRKVVAEGPRILLNGRPLVVRGVLTWGYYPPLLAPAPNEELFRTQLRYLRDCGFNLIKFCLWLPPKTLLDIVDEEGMLAWVEYPTWHTKIDQAHRADLMREYAELSHHDGDHPSVILRSITCETGPSADLDVLRDIYNLLKRRCPGTLVEDDSSWITWNRIHDFWDDHSYGNNRTWRDKLDSLDQHIQTHGVKPFLLGEAIFADTWADTERLLDASVDARPWWVPRWLDDQLAFERDLELRFGLPGFSPIDDLKVTANKYAMDMRRWQLETFRDQMPDSGYVVSVIRDMRLANMGLIDNFDRPKWSVKDWAFHGAAMTSLNTAGDQRAFRCTPDTPLRIKPSVRLTGERKYSPRQRTTWHLDSVKNSQKSLEDDAIQFDFTEQVETPTPVKLTRTQKNTARNRRDIAWEMWALPDPSPIPSDLIVYGDQPDEGLESLFPSATELATGKPIPASTSAVVTYALSEPVIAYLEQGGRVLHLTSAQRGSLRTESLWFGRGTAWAPPVPQAFFDRCPRQMLSTLQLFELGGTDVMRGETLWDQVDPLLTFLETHDLERVRPNLLLFVTGVGRGRLAVSCLRHEGGQTDNYAGLWLARELVSYLIEGSAPTRALSKELSEAIVSGLTAEVQDVEGPWQFRKDPKAVGVEKAWFRTDTDTTGWSQLTPRSAEEGDIWNRYDGWGWCRKAIDIPEHWQGRRVHLVFDSVDDMYELHVNGKKAGAYGKMDRSESSFLKRTWQDVSSVLRYGESNQITVRVYDWVGSGGLNGDIWFTTGPADPELDLIHR